MVDVNDIYEEGDGLAKFTGLKDRNGKEIYDGDMVSLDGNITADNSMGELPNGWCWEEDDIYKVYFDTRIDTWSLKLSVEPDCDYNRKYMDHAINLLHDGNCVVVEKKEGKSCHL